MLHDFFHSFSYVGGVVLTTYSIKLILLQTNIELTREFELFVSGIYLGLGIVLIQQFIFLNKVSKSTDSIKTMKHKIEDLRSKID
jgi:L-lactate permease